MSGLTIVTPPSIEPLTNAETINYLRLDSGVDNMLVESLITTARTWVEDYTKRTLINTTLKLSLDSVYGNQIPMYDGVYTAPYKSSSLNFIELPQSPVSSVTHVKYFNDSDTESTWATSNYYVDLVRHPARIVLRDGGSWPTDLRNANGIEVTYVAGYGSNRSDVPEPIRTAMLQYIVYLYEHRGDFERFPPPEPPKILTSLLLPFTTLRYGVSSFGGGY
jgi:hypothetical protein